MDAERFDTLIRSFVASSSSTRRRILLGLVSALGAGVPLTLSVTADARKKRRRKRKRKKKLRCPTGLAACNRQCRLPLLAACETATDCCSTRCYFQLCRPCGGMPCFDDDECCAGVACEAKRCGGCQAEGGACLSDDDCCFSACNVGRCLSQAGEPCATGIDCADCYPGDTATGCMGWCVAGRCRCPTECCSDPDCPPQQVCRNGECGPIIE